MIFAGSASSNRDSDAANDRQQNYGRSPRSGTCRSGGERSHGEVQDGGRLGDGRGRDFTHGARRGDGSARGRVGLRQVRDVTLVEHGGGRIAEGSIELTDRAGRKHNLVRSTPGELRAMRGADMAMIFQEPMTSLNPVFTVGDQIAESLKLHRKLADRQIKKEVVRLLNLVRIPDPENVAARFPHQLSGGMRQRVMIAMALACRPKLLIADEPTTALDVTVQAQILALIRKLQAKTDTGVLFITHDMGVVAEVADRVCVMRYGKIVEEGPCVEVFANPKHAYTRALLTAVPRVGAMNGTDAPRRFELLDPVTGQTMKPESDGSALGEREGAHPHARRRILAQVQEAASGDDCGVRSLSRGARSLRPRVRPLRR